MSNLIVAEIFRLPKIQGFGGISFIPKFRNTLLTMDLWMQKGLSGAVLCLETQRKSLDRVTILGNKRVPYAEPGKLSHIFS